MAIYAALYITAFFLMFFVAGAGEGKGYFKGSLGPWVIMIVMAVIAIAFLTPWDPVNKMSPKLVILFGTLMLINLLMGLGSLLDILGTKNYAVTAVMFFLAPPITLVSEGLRK